MSQTDELLYQAILEESNLLFSWAKLVKEQAIEGEMGFMYETLIELRKSVARLVVKVDEAIERASVNQAEAQFNVGVSTTEATPTEPLNKD